MTCIETFKQETEAAKAVFDNRMIVCNGEPLCELDAAQEYAAAVQAALTKYLNCRQGAGGGGGGGT